MTWVAVVGVALGSYVLRALPMWIGDRWTASKRLDQVIAHAGTAALAALVAGGLRPDVVAANGAVTTATLAAAGAALVVAVRGASMLRVLAGGIAAYVAVLATASLIA